MLPESNPSAPLFTGAEYPIHPERIPQGNIQQGRYVLTFASTPHQLNAVLRLRFEVFNLEMGEGLESSYAAGMDRDPYDASCHHLMVIDSRDGQVVGTYRLQTDEMASQNLGFYSAGEFQLSQLPEEVLTSCVELGRACIHAAHRNRAVLFLLWKGLAAYVLFNAKRYFFGCSSLTSQNPQEGLDMLAYLTARGHVHPHLQAPPQPGLECFEDAATGGNERDVTVPTLFRTYLRYGAKICGPPAIDREFKTIDFLMLFDLAGLDDHTRQMFFE